MTSPHVLANLLTVTSIWRRLKRAAFRGEQSKEQGSVSRGTLSQEQGSVSRGTLIQEQGSVSRRTLSQREPKNNKGIEQNEHVWAALTTARRRSRGKKARKQDASNWCQSTIQHIQYCYSGVLLDSTINKQSYILQIGFFICKSRTVYCRIQSNPTVTVLYLVLQLSPTQLYMLISVLSSALLKCYVLNPVQLNMWCTCNCHFTKSCEHCKVRMVVSNSCTLKKVNQILCLWHAILCLLYWSPIICILHNKYCMHGSHTLDAFCIEVSLQFSI